MESRRRGDVDPEDHDRISGMPDPVLANILSFLPMVEAVRTGILSTRWGYLWTKLPSLCFGIKEHTTIEEKMEVVNFVNYVLSLHQTLTIEKFILVFTLGNSPLEEMSEDDKKTAHMFASQVDVWARFMLKWKADDIFLDFSGEVEHIYGTPLTNKTPYKLPYHFFSNDSVKKMILGSCIIEPLKPINWNSLKELELRGCILNDKALECILSGTQLLKTLHLIDCIGMKILNITSPELEILNISTSPTSELTITAPHVQQMNINGGLAAYNIINLSSLQVASIDTQLDEIKGSHVEIMRRIVESVHCAQTLALSTDNLQVLSMLEIQTQPFLQSLGCTTLKLLTNLTKWELPGIENVLRASLILESLIIQPDECSDGLQIDNKCVEEIIFYEENYWSSCLEFPCLSKTLKFVNIYGFTYQSSEIALVEFLLKNAQVLEKMIIFCKETDDSSSDNSVTSIDLLSFRQTLMSIGRASVDAIVSFQ